MATGRFLSTGQYARLHGVSRNTVSLWIRKGLLEAERTKGGQYRIPAENPRPKES